MKFKKLCALLLVCITLLTGVTACQLDKRDGEEPLPEPVNGNIRVVIYEAGTGTQWLKKMAEEYQRQAFVKVNVSVSYIPGEIVSQLDSDTLTADIIMPLAQLYKYQNAGKLADLTDVYNAVPEGESQAIKDKMNSGIYEKRLAESKDGKIYQMSWIDSVSTLMYNKSTLDKAFGENNYNLPRTTDELEAFAKEINGKGVYPFATSTQVSYLQYAILTWWAQYEGYDSYYDYYQGYYRDDDNNRHKDTTGENTLNAVGRQKAIEAASDLFSLEAGYSHAYCEAMSFTEAQTAFLSQGYKNKDPKEVAFMVNGDWLENEMSTYLAYKWQDIRAMRMPVISAIREKCPSIADDAELAALIEAIDNGSTELSGTGYDVEQTHFDKVAEARSMAYSAGFDHPVAILESSQKKDLAKGFLTFLASDKGQATYAKQLNGLTQCYGYTPDATTMSAFAQSRQSLFKNYTPVIIDYSSPLYLGAGFTAFNTGSSTNLSVYNGQANQILTATYNAYKPRWSEIIAFAD